MATPDDQFYAGTGGQSYSGGPSVPAPPPSPGYGAVQPYGGQGARPAPVPYGHPARAGAYGQNQVVIAMLGQKSSGIAAILSILLVGAGQMYCGHVGRGLAFLAGSVAAYFFMFVSLGFLFFVPLGVFIWALVDAVKLANRHNADLVRRLTYGGTGF